jgi:hypothetical protein
MHVAIYNPDMDKMIVLRMTTAVSYLFKECLHFTNETCDESFTFYAEMPPDILFANDGSAGRRYFVTTYGYAQIEFKSRRHDTNDHCWVCDSPTGCRQWLFPTKEVPAESITINFPVQFPLDYRTE